MEAVLTEVLSTALPPLNAVSGRIGNLQLLSDVEILHLSELQPEPEWDRRLSGLLERQQAGELTLLEGEELRAMMGEYEANLLLKSEALVEAVRRGLRPPLSP